MCSFPPGGSTSSTLSRHFSHCVAEIIYAYVLAELGKFCLSMRVWAHLPDKTVPTALTQQYTKLVVKFSAQTPSVLSSEAWTYHSRSKQIPLCRVLTVGGNAIEWIPDWLSVWLFYCLSFCLSGQLTCNSINIHNRNNNNNYDSGCYLEPSADTHIFGGSRSPFCTAPRPFIVCFCLLCVFLCVCPLYVWQPRAHHKPKYWY